MRMKAMLFLAGVIAAGSAAAWQKVQVEYSADSTMETAQAAMKARVYHAIGKERRESNQGGQQMTTITREDKKVIWVLMPDQRMYMEMKAGTQRGPEDISGYKVEQTAIGPETVNGISTTKNKMIMTSPDGTKLGGFSWVTKDGVVVKMDMLAIDKGSKQRIKMELTNLKIGKQDPALFDIPSGYSKMPIPGMMQPGGPR
jgi:hypothetical protein